MKKLSALLICPALLLQSTFAADLTLWYQQPANNPMNETLPIGNGSLGALVFGASQKERLSINEDSLWTGDENLSGDYGGMGAYQVLGNVFVNLPGHDKDSNYRRDLDISDALAHVSYESGGVKFQREYFASHPAGVLVARFTADKPGSYTGSFQLEDSHRAQAVASANRLIVSGTLNNGLKYEWQMVVIPDGGTLVTNGSTIEFQNCNGFTLFIAAGTDYAMDYARHYRGEDPHARLAALLDEASKKSYAKLKQEHIKDFHSIFNRVQVDFGMSTDARRALPTDQRKLEAFKTVDPELEQLLFEYGRYLLISCSRPGGLPANLQGLWNDRNDPPWSGDYHANINVEMNYWPVEAASLAECHLPFLDLIQSQLPAWRKATAASPDFKTPSGAMTTRGFAIRTSHNIFGGMGWKWDMTANAWYCQHLWEHYAFGLDKNYLREVACPILKETCEFWEDHLKALPDGRLVVPHGWSPEHGPDEDGVSYNQEIVWNLFDNYVQASDALGVDKDYRNKVAAMRDQLVTPKIGRWGQLQEWMTDRDDPNDHHRHTSHLFAVYPGNQISFTKTPELAKAAKISLDARGIDAGSDVREWSFAWRTALYARLQDGEDAHRMLQQLFSARNTCPNLFGLHPPMQIDGNFGITAGVSEMLLQSQAGEIQLLPALPTAWPGGSVKGLRARGGFQVDENWQGGKLVSASISSITNAKARVRYGGRMVEVQLKPGRKIILNAKLESKN